MQGWQATYLGMRELPREFSAFELQAFFAFSRSERELIDARRGAALKLGLALHIGFLRMSGRLLIVGYAVKSPVDRTSPKSRNKPCGFALAFPVVTQAGARECR
jgi:hypothetical protein